MRLAFLGMGAILLASSVLSRASGPGFIGATRCKLCHREVYQLWEKTPHARASAELPETDERCLRCHATGDGRFPGVQCEACHGPGENYWPAEVMMDPDKASMAGLWRPTEAICRRCHVNDEPAHLGELVMPPQSERPRFVH